MKSIGLLKEPTKYLFFTGKGGVGKTSVSSAVAINLADSGKKILLVSTDAASNLDEMLGVELRNYPVKVPSVLNLSVLSIDPNVAADDYRKRVLDQMGAQSTDEEKANVKEQLSGACTTEIAAFDEFANLLAENKNEYDHIIFDTAPTGHTLRLLSLPKAWTGFLSGNDRGASCLGPHSGLKMQESRFLKALNTLSDKKITTVILVTRPENGAIREISKTSNDLMQLGLSNQRLVINGKFKAASKSDEIALSIEKLESDAINSLPVELKNIPQDEVTLKSFDTVGISALRNLLNSEIKLKDEPRIDESPNDISNIQSLIEEFSKREHGLIMVMGKGGVGKTTIASAIAIGLIKKGKKVHLTTTDPAAHLEATIQGTIEGLTVDKIDPKVETQNYIDKIMERKGARLSSDEKKLLLEDLQSPCTEEVAVFHGFSRMVSKAQNNFVVMDTAPTGHSLLLIDATGAYHKQSIRDLSKAGLSSNRIVTPLMRLQDPNYTQILLVTLPETTPVIQAQELQEDLIRANIEPYAWIINKSLLHSGTRDPLLVRRMEGEGLQIKKIKNSLAKRLYFLPWQTTPPVGIKAISKMVETPPIEKI
jgi:arsenite-transporting ATPase